MCGMKEPPPSREVLIPGPIFIDPFKHCGEKERWPKCYFFKWWVGGFVNVVCTIGGWDIHRNGNRERVWNERGSCST